MLIQCLCCYSELTTSTIEGVILSNCVLIIAINQCVEGLLFTHPKDYWLFRYLWWVIWVIGHWWRRKKLTLDHLSSTGINRYLCILQPPSVRGMHHPSSIIKQGEGHTEPKSSGCTVPQSNKYMKVDKSMGKILTKLNQNG